MDREAAKRLRAAGIDWIATSLYGPDDFHDAMVRVPGTRQRVIDAIKILREEGVDVAIKTAISKDTWPHIYDLIAEAKELDVGLLYFCDLITAGRSEGEDDGRITAEQWRELGDFIIDDILSEESHDGVGHRRDAELHPLRRRAAHRARHRRLQRPRAPQDHLGVPGGQGPHEHQLRGRHHALPVRSGLDDRQRARDVAAGRRVRALRARPAGVQGRVRPEACDYSRICRGCRAKAWQRTGDPMAEDVTCLLHAETDRSELVAHIEATPEFQRSAPCSVPGSC